MSNAAAAAAKARGNEYFNKGKYDAAVEAYSEAIALDAGVAVYYTNRAFANFKKDAGGRASAIEADCRAALGLDPRSAKANYYLGKVLSARSEHGEALRHFERAYDIQPPFKDDVRRALWQAKKELWQAEQAQEDEKTLEFVLAAIDRSFQTELTQCNGHQERAELRQQYEKHIAAVRTRLARAPPESEVPQHLCCQISWSPLVDPVITPAGITYERRLILDHLQRGNKFDPVTRAPLQASELYPNKMMVDAVDEYITEHPDIFFAAI